MSETDNITPLHADPDAPQPAPEMPVCAVTLYLLPDGSAKWQLHEASEGTQRDANEDDARRLCDEVGGFLIARKQAALTLQMLAARQVMEQAAPAKSNGKRNRLHLPDWIKRG